MRFSALASGSSGNCFYLENENKSILIDAGISRRQIVDRLASIKRNPENIRGIFVTHEHSDHIRGIDVFAREFGIPVFVTKDTRKSCFLCSDDDLINTIKNNDIIKIGGMEVEAFSKSHKASDPVSYNIQNGKKISIITDVGYACDNIIEQVSDSDFLCLESNHDIAMLENGPYPYFLKKWIASDIGHLSNLQAGLIVLEHGSNKLKNVVLAHLSQTNNTPETAMRTFSSLIKERKNISPRMFVSERFKPTSLIKF